MIGKVIKSLLDSNAALLALVPSARIYPYVMNEGTPLPAIIYTVDTLEPEYCKDGWAIDDYTFSVVCFSDNYSNLQDIALQIRAALELKRGTIEGIKINKIYLRGMTEGYSLSESSYLNKQTFELDVVTK